jgi:hypothetical protein
MILSYNFVAVTGSLMAPSAGWVAYDFGPATIARVATRIPRGSGRWNVMTPQGYMIFREVTYKICCFDEAPVTAKYIRSI